MTTPGALRRYLGGQWLTEGSYIGLFDSFADLPNTDEDDIFALTRDTKVLYRSSGGVWVTFSTGGSGGATNLDGLTDVTLASPADTQVLTYETASGQWKNKAGIPGPTGPQGPQGVPGPTGGTGGHASFTFNSATTEPIVGNQLRLNNASQTAATKMWVSETDTDGLDVSIGLAKILAGHQVYFQDFDDATKWVKYRVTADGIDKGAYWEFGISYLTGPGNVPFQKVEFQAIAPGTVGVIPGGTTGQVLAKKSNTDYDTQWSTPAAGGGATDYGNTTIPAGGIFGGLILIHRIGQWCFLDLQAVYTTASFTGGSGSKKIADLNASMFPITTNNVFFPVSVYPSSNADPPRVQRVFIEPSTGSVYLWNVTTTLASGSTLLGTVTYPVAP